MEFTAEASHRGPWNRPGAGGAGTMGYSPERFNAIYAKPSTLSGRYIPLVTVSVSELQHNFTNELLLKLEYFENIWFFLLT